MCLRARAFAPLLVACFLACLLACLPPCLLACLPARPPARPPACLHRVDGQVVTRGLVDHDGREVDGIILKDPDNPYRRLVSYSVQEHCSKKTFLSHAQQVRADQGQETFDWLRESMRLSHEALLSPAEVLALAGQLAEGEAEDAEKHDDEGEASEVEEAVGAIAGPSHFLAPAETSSKGRKRASRKGVEGTADVKRCKAKSTVFTVAPTLWNPGNQATPQRVGKVDEMMKQLDIEACLDGNESPGRLLYQARRLATSLEKNKADAPEVAEALVHFKTHLELMAVAMEVSPKKVHKLTPEVIHRYLVRLAEAEVQFPKSLQIALVSRAARELFHAGKMKECLSCCALVPSKAHAGASDDSPPEAPPEARAGASGGKPEGAAALDSFDVLKPQLQKIQCSEEEKVELQGRILLTDLMLNLFRGGQEKSKECVKFAIEGVAQYSVLFPTCSPRIKEATDMLLTIFRCIIAVATPVPLAHGSSSMDVMAVNDARGTKDPRALIGAAMNQSEFWRKAMVAYLANAVHENTLGAKLRDLCASMTEVGASDVGVVKETARTIPELRHKLRAGATAELEGLLAEAVKGVVATGSTEKREQLTETLSVVNAAIEALSPSAPNDLQIAQTSVTKQIVAMDNKATQDRFKVALRTYSGQQNDKWLDEDVLQQLQNELAFTKGVTGPLTVEARNCAKHLAEAFADTGTAESETAVSQRALDVAATLVAHIRQTLANGPPKAAASQTHPGEEEDEDDNPEKICNTLMLFKTGFELRSALREYLQLAEDTIGRVNADPHDMRHNNLKGRLDGHLALAGDTGDPVPLEDVVEAAKKALNAHRDRRVLVATDALKEAMAELRTVAGGAANGNSWKAEVSPTAAMAELIEVAGGSLLKQRPAHLKSCYTTVKQVAVPNQPSIRVPLAVRIRSWLAASS